MFRETLGRAKDTGTSYRACVIASTHAYIHARDFHEASGSDLETRRVNRPRKHNKLRDNKRSVVRSFTIIMPSAMADPCSTSEATRNE